MYVCDHGNAKACTCIKNISILNVTIFFLIFVSVSSIEHCLTGKAFHIQNKRKYSSNMKSIRDISSIPHLMIHEIMHTCFGGEMNSCASWYLNPKEVANSSRLQSFIDVLRSYPPAHPTKAKGVIAPLFKFLELV